MITPIREKTCHFLFSQSHKHLSMLLQDFHHLPISLLIASTTATDLPLSLNLWLRTTTLQV